MTALERLVSRSGAVSGKLGLRDLLYRSFRAPTTGALVALIIVTLTMLAAASRIVAASTRETILAEARRSLSEITTREATIRNEVFARISSYARLLQRQQEEILAAPEAFPPPKGPITLSTAPNGNKFKAEEFGASVFLPARITLSDDVRALAQRTKAFDPGMQNILSVMPETIVAVYFNSTESLNRYLPHIPKVAEQYEPTIDTTAFNFFYVADTKNDPEGIPKWTEVYLDPAGLGWVVSCAVPIREKGLLRGVTGIDVTIEKLLKNVVELPLPFGGSAMLTTADGQILAMGHRAAGLVGMRELVHHRYEGTVAAETLKPEGFRVDRISNEQARRFFARAIHATTVQGAEDVTIGSEEFVITQARLKETGWHLFVATPKTELLSPLQTLQTRSIQVAFVVVFVFVIVGAIVMAFLLRQSQLIGEAIAAPIRRLSEETAKVGTTLAPRILDRVGIDEIDGLTTNFGQMALELSQRQQALLDSEVARNVQKRSQEFLLRVLPEPIVHRMVAGEKVIADAHACVTVVFADIVGFTPFAAQLQPHEVVRVLERVFVAFDGLAALFGVEKIKTIGDAYMAVAGVPIACDDHAERAARMALAMLDALARIDTGHHLQMRIGVHSGPAVAGVIGTDKFLYDLWGDTVNIASRVESHGEAGRVQVTKETAAQLGDRFVLELRGEVQLHGRGITTTY